MYEKTKTYIETIKQQITYKRLIVGAICVLLLVGIGQLARGYFTARANYNRAIERLESTQRALDDSRKLNQQLKIIIDRGASLNGQARERIERIEDYQRREGEGLNRLEGYQQETGRRVGEGIGSNNRASELIGESLDIIRRVENGTKEQPKN